MDTRLRELERRAQEDPQAYTQLLAYRLRAGQLSRENIRLAAHLGHAPSIQLSEDAAYQIKCSCQPGAAYCYSCGGSGAVTVEEGLISTISMVCPREIPLELIGSWACDCVFRALDEQSSYMSLAARIIPPVREWLRIRPTVKAPLMGLQQDARSNVGVSDFYVSAARELIQATNMPAERESANRFGHAVSFAYHATGHRRAVRNWQIGHLIKCLLA